MPYLELLKQLAYLVSAVEEHSEDSAEPALSKWLCLLKLIACEECDPLFPHSLNRLKVLSDSTVQAQSSKAFAAFGKLLISKRPIPGFVVNNRASKSFCFVVSGESHRSEERRAGK